MNANQQALRHCKGHESYNQYCLKCFEINFDRSRDFAPPEIRSGAWVDALRERIERDLDGLEKSYAFRVDPKDMARVLREYLEMLRAGEGSASTVRMSDGAN